MIFLILNEVADIVSNGSIKFTQEYHLGALSESNERAPPSSQGAVAMGTDRTGE
jgi:hypothetical protein